MSTPTDWPDTLEKVRKVLDTVKNRECTHPGWKRVYRADFGLGYRTLMHVECKCGKYLGTFG